MSINFLQRVDYVPYVSTEMEESFQWDLEIFGTPKSLILKELGKFCSPEQVNSVKDCSIKQLFDNADLWIDTDFLIKAGVRYRDIYPDGMLLEEWEAIDWVAISQTEKELVMNKEFMGMGLITYSYEEREEK